MPSIIRSTKSHSKKPFHSLSSFASSSSSSSSPSTSLTSLTSFPSRRRHFHQTRRVLAPPLPGVKVAVNGRELEVPQGATVLQACQLAGVDVPRFCYHERLSIAGNCRMCLVEVEKSPKPVASCAMPVMKDMRIKTDTDLVKKAREGVMEFLLANHPLDCPICDQGGECDLQDQSIFFGSDRSRFREWKRGVEDKNLGPFVKTVMTRCIHCTRCVRFAGEVAGVEDLGVTGRGNSMEIGTYVEKVFDSELSGNVIDLCPVGALTSKPFAFTARPWELEHTESVDVLDAVGSNIRIDTRGAEVMRILPRLHEEVNEEWISDKTRFAYDGLKRQRLDTPYSRQGEEYVAISWEEALKQIRDAVSKIDPSTITAVSGPLVDCETLVVAKDLLSRLGANRFLSTQSLGISSDFRSNYLFNTTIQGIEEADVLLLVGTNPRMEAPLINSRIRKSVLHYGLKVATIGPKMDLAFEGGPKVVEELGDDISLLSKILSGEHPYSKKLAEAKRPVVVVGVSSLAKGTSIHRLVRQLEKKYPKLKQEGWNGVNVLHTNASTVGALDVGFSALTPSLSDSKLVYLLGVDDEDFLSKIPKDAFVIYQGHHGDIGAQSANLVLPTTSYVEKVGTYVNLEGRPQTTEPAVGPLGQAREDWEIFRALSEVLGVTLPYDSFPQVRERLYDVAPHLERLDRIETPSLSPPTLEGITIETPQGPISPVIQNFFTTDPISRSSRTLAKASAQLPKARNSYL